MQALDEFATKLIENEHYAADDVAARRDAVSKAGTNSTDFNDLFSGLFTLKSFAQEESEQLKRILLVLLLMTDSFFQLLQRRNALYEKSHIRRSRLEESYKFQMFERDCDETKIWINEKLKAASDEGYLVCSEGNRRKHF